MYYNTILSTIIILLPTLIGVSPLNEDCIGLVPAAGKGMRLGLPYPKELYPVIRNNRYKPVAQFILENLVFSKVKNIVFVINETKNQLIGYFGSGARFGCNISYVVQEMSSDSNFSTSPGLANALDSAYHLTKGKIVCFGMPDTIIQPKNIFEKGVSAFNPSVDLLLYLFPTNTPQKFGMVSFNMSNQVLKIVDKPVDTDLENMWGCMMWRPKFTEFLHQSLLCGENDFANIVNNAISKGFNVIGIPVEDGTFYDMGTYEEIMKLDQHYRESEN